MFSGINKNVTFDCEMKTQMKDLWAMLFSVNTRRDKDAFGRGSEGLKKSPGSFQPQEFTWLIPP